MKDFKLKALTVLVFLFGVSCEEIIEVEDISDQNIEILAPLNNTIVNTSNVSFNWTKLQDSISYRVQVAQPNFSVAQQLLIDSVVTTTSVTKTLEDGNYEWRVQAFNTAYETPFTLAGFEVSTD